MAQIGIVRAINDLSYWRITVTNGPVPNTNVEVVFTLPVEFSIDSATIVPAGTLIGTTWSIGAMTAGQVLSADIILQFDGPVPGLSESFDITAVVSGTGDTNVVNNTKTDTILFEIVSCDPLASGSACEAGLKFDLSECSTPCTQGATPEWFIVPASEVNVNIIDFDATTGIGYYEFIDPSIPGSFTWGLNCLLGEDTIVICSTYTMTLHPLIDDKDVFDHTADYVEGSTLTADQINILQAQPAYSGMTDEQIQALCWETLYNADGDLVGGWAHDCTGSQDNRSFVFCSEVDCVTPEPDPCPECPSGTMPVDVTAYLATITNYTPEEGDTITVYHKPFGTTSFYTYSGTQWVMSSCGCIVTLSADADNMLSLGTDGGLFLSEVDFPAVNPYPVSAVFSGTGTKTLTITLSNGVLLTPSFTDIDTNTTYTIEINDGNIELIDQMNNVVSSTPLPAASGDDWGTQVVDHDATIAGNGTPASPLKIAQQGATNGQVLKWNGITWLPAADSGEVNTASNLGTGEEVFSAKVGVDLQFRTLVAGTNITLTQTATEIEIESGCCCPCQPLVYTTDNETFYLHTENCDGKTFTWQEATGGATLTWSDVQVGGASYVLVGALSLVFVRVKWVDGACTLFSNAEHNSSIIVTP